MAVSLELADFADAIERCLGSGAPWPGAVAVSGGGDSLALLQLMAEWARGSGRKPPVVLTVDHGLSPEGSRASREALSRARALALEAHQLHWRGPKPASDIEASARAARYALMGSWCRDRGLGGLYVAHTRDDQAETFLLRLARGSGLDGLSAMREISPYPVPGFSPLQVVRPLLGTTRAALRQFLAARAIAWSEDPMNFDPRFARARIRGAWPLLADIGLSVERIAAASDHLARAREALDAATATFLDEACRFEEGKAVFDGTRLAQIPAEIGLRVLAHLLGRISNAVYRPRFEQLERLYLAIVSGQLRTARTLHGCRIGKAPRSAAAFGEGTLQLTREPPRKTPKKAGVAAHAEIS